jgi:AcrR family transcriptional regulator
MTQAPRRRGRPRGATLDRQQVLAAAAELARQDVSALTMSALAESLGVTSMALYRHYASKEELLSALHDDVLRRVKVPPRQSGDWADRLRRLHRDVVAALERCPGLRDVIGELPPGPESARLLEGYLAILLDSGVDAGEALLAYTAIYYLAIGGITNGAGPHKGKTSHASPVTSVNATHPSELLARFAPDALTLRHRRVQDYGIDAVIDSISFRHPPTATT